MLQVPAAYRPLLQRIATLVADSDVYLSGGTPRDSLLDRPIHDLDLLTSGDGLELARRLADALGGAFFALDEARGTGRAVFPGEGLVVDVARMRAPTLEADLRLRDLTINALAAPLAPLLAGADSLPLIDPCGGQADLVARQLRMCDARAFQDDPLRLLRTLRLAAGLGFTTEPATLAQMRADAPAIVRVAGERVRDELTRLLETAGGAWGLRLLDELRILTRIFPELEPARDCEQPIVHVLPVLAHSLEAVTAMEWMLLELGLGEPHDAGYPYAPVPLALRRHPRLRLELPFAERLREELASPLSAGRPRFALLKLATLLHDNAKPQTKRPKEDGSGGVSFHDHQAIGAELAGEIGRRLKFSRHEVSYLATVVREHMRPGQLLQIEPLTTRAVGRFFRDCGAAAPDVLLHSLADHMATRGQLLKQGGWLSHAEWVGALLTSQWATPEEPAPLLDGRTLMRELDVPQGPEVGRLLSLVREAQLAGEVASADEALALARQLR
jgi:poly(A) polymerase/tRNA nucleotidyltransferase (CCA-adding enzyme)